MKESVPHRLSRLAEEMELDRGFVDDVMSRVNRVPMRQAPWRFHPAAMMLASAALLLLGVGIGFVAAGGAKPTSGTLAASMPADSILQRTTVSENRNGRLLSLEYAPSSEQVAVVVMTALSQWPEESEMVVILSSARPSEALTTLGTPLLTTSLTRQELLDALKQQSNDHTWTVEPAVSIRTSTPPQPLNDLVRNLTRQATAFDAPLTRLTLWERRFD